VRGPLVARAVRVRSLLQFVAKFTDVILCRLRVASEGSGFQTAWLTDHIHLGDVLHGLEDADQGLTSPPKASKASSTLPSNRFVSARNRLDLISELSRGLPVNAFHGARGNSFFNAFFRSSFR